MAMKPQQYMKLHVGLSNPSIEQSDVVDYIQDYLMERSHAPSGATIRPGIGLWKDQRERNLTVEIWTDSDEEREAVKRLKLHLESEFDRDCVCLSRGSMEMTHDVGLEVEPYTTT